MILDVWVFKYLMPFKLRLCCLIVMMQWCSISYSDIQYALSYGSEKIGNVTTISSLNSFRQKFSLELSESYKSELMRENAKVGFNFPLLMNYIHYSERRISGRYSINSESVRAHIQGGVTFSATRFYLYNNEKLNENSVFSRSGQKLHVSLLELFSIEYGRFLLSTGVPKNVCDYDFLGGCFQITVTVEDNVSEVCSYRWEGFSISDREYKVRGTYKANMITNYEILAYQLVKGHMDIGRGIELTREQNLTLDYLPASNVNDLTPALIKGTQSLCVSPVEGDDRALSSMNKAKDSGSYSLDSSIHHIRSHVITKPHSVKKL